jgi:hypothetical protein
VVTDPLRQIVSSLCLKREKGAQRMSNKINVYWSHVRNSELDLSILYEEPSSLIHELSLNKNKNNPDDNLLRCPAVTDLAKNLFVVKNPVETSASFVIEDGSVSSKMDSKKGGWFVNRSPSLENQLLAAYDYSLIFFAEEEVEMMVTSPYFSQTPHRSWGAIVPGMFNIGSWFRPFNIEFNVWPGITNIYLEEGEPIAYIKFFTDKNVVFKRFTMNDELMMQAKTCSSAGFWEPRVPLLKRYQRFKNSKRKDFVLNKIKNNLL